MNEYEIKNIVSNQRKYFLSGATLDINARVSALKKLKDSIIKHEPEINEADGEPIFHAGEEEGAENE